MIAQKNHMPICLGRVWSSSTRIGPLSASPPPPSAFPPFPRLRMLRQGASPSFLTLRASATEEDVDASSPSPSLDVSVFRFTLGIPGFDDADLPRVIGITLGAILLLNHFLSSDSITPAQWRSEVLGLCGAIVSINLPSIGRILNGTSSASAVKLSERSQIFVLDKDLSKEDKEELAWTSYALLKNTKATSLAICNEKLLCARGYWNIPNRTKDDALQWIEETLKRILLFPCSSVMYIPSKADRYGLNVLVDGVVCALVLPDKQHAKKCFVLLSSIPDAFKEKDIIWAERLLEKFHG